MMRIKSASRGLRPKTILAAAGLIAGFALSSWSAVAEPMPEDTKGPARATVDPGTGCGVNKNQHCPSN